MNIQKSFLFLNSEAKYIYLVLATVGALHGGDDYNDGAEDLAEIIFGLNNMKSFFNFIFHVDSDKISGLFH